MRVCSVKLAFHGADTDTDTDTDRDILADFRARIVARMSACPARTRILADLSDTRDFPREDVR